MKLRKIETRSHRPEMISLIGIVFIMTMLFIIVMTFENIKADERIKLPRNLLARPPVVRPERELELNFVYQRDESGHRLRALPEILTHDRYTPLREISGNLQMERNVLERLHGSAVIKDVTVLIHADPEVPAGLVQELIKKCQEIGFTKFSLRPSAKDL